MSDNLKWEAHVDDLIQRSSRRLFSLVILRKTGVKPSALWRYYCAAIRSVILYSYPAWCNCGSGQWDKLNKIERRALRLMGSTNSPTLHQAADQICRNLMENVEKHEDHPLRELVEERVVVTKTRNSRKIKAPWARTSRLRESFISYADM